MGSLLSWKEKTLGELAQYLNGKAFKPADWKKSGIPIIRIQNLTNPSNPFNYFDGTIENRYKVDTGDLLISWSATLGSFIWDRGPAVLNQHIFKVLPNNDLVDKEFLHFLVLNTLGDMAKHSHGLAMKHITKKKFEALKVSIPSLKEQRRIVTRIKECMERVEEIAGLRSLIELEKGGLVASIRYESMAIDAPKCSLGDLIIKGPTNGLYKPAKFYGSGVPILRIDNFDGGDVIQETSSLRRLEVDKSEAARYSLEVGDIVLNRVNGSLDVVGKACIVNKLQEITVFESNMMKLKIDHKKADSRYVLHFLTSPLCRDQIKSKAKVIQQASINQKDVCSFTIPLPDLKRQEEIADYLDNMSVIAGNFCDSTFEQISHTSKIRESILRKAFAGEL